MNGTPFFLQPGIFELIYGSMFSRKTEALMAKVKEFDYYKSKSPGEIDYLLFKPDNDKRDEGIKSRSGDEMFHCERIPRDQPFKVIDVINHHQQRTGKKIKLVGFDELQFFADEIAEVILALQLQNKHVIAAALDRDYRGLIFGPMGLLIPMANKPHRKYAICDFGSSCAIPGTLTQKLINGEPAPYSLNTNDIISVQGAKPEETYQSRCIKHHIVPGKPESELVRILKSL